MYSKEGPMYPKEMYMNLKEVSMYLMGCQSINSFFIRPLIH